MHALSTQFGFVLSSFSRRFETPLFVFNDLVASFVSFFIYSRFPVSLCANTIPAISRAFGAAALAYDNVSAI
jgi:hypothetical protein